MAKKFFNEKLNDSKDMPKIIEMDDPKMIASYGKKMLIAPPLFYDEIMKRVPCQKLITVDRIRDYLAKKHGADFTCPLNRGNIYIDFRPGLQRARLY